MNLLTLCFSYFLNNLPQITGFLIIACLLFLIAFVVTKKKKSLSSEEKAKKLKRFKIILLALSIIILLIVIGALVLIGMWNGAFGFLFPEEIATYESPNGEYSLVAEELGTAGLFGPTDVRFILKDSNGKVVNRVTTEISNDGGADEHNIVSVSWKEDYVVILLRGSEMEDKRVAIPYQRR